MDLKKHKKIHSCPNCLSIFKKSTDLHKHLNNRKKVTCDHCKRTFCNNDEFQKHLRSIRKKTDNSTPDLDQRVYPETGYEDEEKYLELIDKKINEIQDYTKKKKYYQEINKQIEPSFTYREINDFLLDYFTKHKNAFKLNFAFGFIMYHTISETYKYHYISSNFYYNKRPSMKLTCFEELSVYDI